MKQSTATWLTVIVALIAIAAPVYIAISMARNLSLDAESNSGLLYARDILHRSELTATQTGQGISRLVAAGFADPCSDESIELMRQIDLSSSYLQTIGYVQGDYLICSSLGRHPAPGLALGPVTHITENNVAIRSDVSFPFAPDNYFIVLSADNYASIIHKDLPLDTTTHQEGVMLAVYSRGNLQQLTSRGAIRPTWMRAEIKDGATTFIDDGYIVSVVLSEQYLIGAVAAIPLQYLTNRTRNFSLLLIPIGLVAGTVLSFFLNRMTKTRLALPAMMRAALKRGEFFLHYQPVVDLHTGKTIGAEALLRWQRANGDMIRTDLFIRVAEDSALIQQITAHVLELVEVDARDVFRRHKNFHLALNISATDCHSDTTVQLMNKLIHTTGAKPRNFLVEATEGSFVDHQLANTVLKKLRESGIMVAIDDFGTGFSSLSVLEKLEIDILKIDQSFVSALGKETSTSNVVMNIIRMAKDLNLKMIAEGIETAEQADTLRTLGVQYGQGWLFGKPQPMKELLRRLDAEAGMPPTPDAISLPARLASGE
ncbi:MAG: EAL domain-containing protein [Pseudomonadota bacterium]